MDKGEGKNIWQKKRRKMYKEGEKKNKGRKVKITKEVKIKQTEPSEKQEVDSNC